MHSGFEIPGIHHQQAAENTCPPLILSMSPTHILDQIHALPGTQQLALDHHHYLPLHHHYPGAAASSSAYFPLNFKLGLSRNDASAAVNVGGLRESEQYQLPEARQSSLGMLHSPFWEPLPAEVSNENSEIVDPHELRQQRRETLTTCLDAKTRVNFSELEAVYKRLSNNETNQTPPNNPLHVTPHLPPSIAEEEEEASGSSKAAKKAKAKKKKKGSYLERQLMSPMAEFFEDLVMQVMDHQENLQRKFTEVMDRLNEERRAREEEWRNQEVAHLEREAAARAHDKAMAISREAIIVSYLEKIAGQRINLPPPSAAAENTSDHSNCEGGGGDED